MSALLTILGAIAIAWILAYHRLPAVVWTVTYAVALGLLTAYAGWPRPVIATLWVVLVALALLFNPTPLRRALVSRPLLALFRKILPQMSDTERDAIAAGTVWWDAELFSGRPDWAKLLAYPKPQLSADERAFLDGPVEELCRMVSDWPVVPSSTSWWATRPRRRTEWIGIPAGPFPPRAPSRPSRKMSP